VKGLKYWPRPLASALYSYDMEKIEAAAQKYKVEILGPPPGAQPKQRARHTSTSVCGEFPRRPLLGYS
jgi:hypothetical protein